MIFLLKNIFDRSAAFRIALDQFGSAAEQLMNIRFRIRE